MVLLPDDFQLPGSLGKTQPKTACTIRELKQTDAAVANLQISIQKNSRPSEYSQPLTSITLNLNRDLPVDRRRVSLLKLPINATGDWTISTFSCFPGKNSGRQRVEFCMGH